MLFSPKLPEEKITAIQKVAMGIENKIILSWKEPWWPSTNTWFAFIWKRADRAKVRAEDYWTTRIFGATCPMGSNNALTLWTSGEIAKLVSSYLLKNTYINCNPRISLPVCLEPSGVPVPKPGSSVF